MLYLLKPGGDMAWIDMPATTTLDLAAKHDVDLARFEWLPAERRADATLTALALRHGTRCSTGIVLEGHFAAELTRRAQLIESQAREPQRRASLASHDAQMERMMPGWTQHGRDLDAGVAASRTNTIAEIDAQLREWLAVSPKPELVERWTALGGPVPSS